MPVAKAPGTYGNLIIKFTVDFPKALTTEQKEKIRSILGWSIYGQIRNKPMHGLTVSYFLRTYILTYVNMCMCIMCDESCNVKFMAPHPYAVVTR